MIRVHLNNGNLIIFKTGKIIFMKEVYKVEEWTCRNENCVAITQRIIYRGEILKRGVEVTVKAECSMNEKGETKWIYY